MPHIKTIADLIQVAKSDNLQTLLIDVAKLLATAVHVKESEEIPEQMKAEVLKGFSEFNWIDDGKNDVTLSSHDSNMRVVIKDRTPLS
ncbi:hypothetical protein [Hymenobacter fodinae]|uniref:Uncharacterized protein n=1 Tax=Hymenobacter fodinae TaxID=2510796 RepID=A0A4Z0P391_9BACT|nr:hypothetical protein [Hymenobacter fodinae]TGE05589.1 hypothetical protein EU556_20015 [Hymenobacter fodinae]